MRKIISLICLLLPLLAFAEELQLKPDAPERYTVVKGDTLWDISAKFFKDPWKWPQIWGYNKDTIKDPHWIYPSNVVYLDAGTHTLKVEGAQVATTETPSPVSAEPQIKENIETPNNNVSAPSPAAGDTAEVDTEVPVETVLPSGAIKISPRARILPGRGEAIPNISLKEIGPFFSRPLVVEDKEMAGSPKLVGTYEQRRLLGAGDVAYAKDMPNNKGERWQIYRPNVTFKDPDTGEVLGHEVMYLGDAVVEKFADISSLKITNAILEISKGDYFAQSTAGFAANFMPRAPNKEISARVISIYGGVFQAGQNAVVTLNKGTRDGLESGHVLALYQKGEVIRNPGWFKPNTVLPDVRYGLLFVFRVFDKVSYALVMETRLPVQLLDRASTPE